MKISVLGLWHLGSVTSASLASLGHEVIGLDFESNVVNDLNRGVAPIKEAGLDELLKQGLVSGKLKFSTSIEAATKDISVLWVAYDTPVDDDDNADVTFVVEQIVRVLPYLSVNTVVLVSSQMPVGSIHHLEQIAARDCSSLQLTFACSPENLRLGKALEVFLKPDRIVVGVRSESVRQQLEPLLQSISNRIEWMSVESAEMTKHAINAFLATSVTFANEIAAICELVGADAKQVERGLKTEARIGSKAYLSPGGPFAGGTLARDITFLNQAAQSKSLVTPLLSSVKPSNDEHKNWVKRKLLEFFPNLTDIKVVVWGLTYKAGTNTLRRSMSVELCDWLISQGANAYVHDPVVHDLPNHWNGKVQQFEDPIEAVISAQVLVVATEWPLYREQTAVELARFPQQLIVLDVNRFVAHFASIDGLKYVAVGTPGNVEKK